MQEDRPWSAPARWSLLLAGALAACALVQSPSTAHELYSNAGKQVYSIAALTIPGKLMLVNTKIEDQFLENNCFGK